MTLLAGLVVGGMAFAVLFAWALARAAGMQEHKMDMDRLSLLRRLERHRGWERR